MSSLSFSVVLSPAAKTGKPETSPGELRENAVNLQKGVSMFGLSKIVIGIIAIVAGLLILIFPELLRWVVGIFLIVWGIFTMLGKK